MMKSKETLLDDYLKSFNKIDELDKNEEILSLLNENTEVLKAILKNNNIEPSVSTNIINNQNDFLDKVLAYIIVNRELLADYIEKKEGMK